VKHPHASTATIAEPTTQGSHLLTWSQPGERAKKLIKEDPVRITPDALFVIAQSELVERGEEARSPEEGLNSLQLFTQMIFFTRPSTILQMLVTKSFFDGRGL
jgi:hypothetical protein